MKSEDFKLLIKSIEEAGELRRKLEQEDLEPEIVEAVTQEFFNLLMKG